MTKSDLRNYGKKINAADQSQGQDFTIKVDTEFGEEILKTQVFPQRYAAYKNKRLQSDKTARYFLLHENDIIPKRKTGSEGERIHRGIIVPFSQQISLLDL